MIKRLRYIILCAMCGEFITRNTWPFLWDHIYFYGESLQRVLYTSVITIFARYVPGRWLFRVACMAFGLAVLDLFDEALFKPYDFEIAEYKAAIVIVTLCCIGLTGFRFILLLIMFNSFILLNRYSNAERKEARRYVFKWSRRSTGSIQPEKMGAGSVGKWLSGIPFSLFISPVYVHEGERKR